MEKSFCVATCVYSAIEPKTAKAIFDARKTMDFDWLVYEGDSLIGKARCIVAHEFLKRSEEIIVFIDADIVFTPEDLKQLVDDVSKGFLIVSGYYPEREGRSEDIFFSQDVRLYARKKYREIVKENNLIFTPVDLLGIGFTAVSRKIFEALVEQKLVGCFRWGNAVIPMFFNTGVLVNEDTPFYLSEDGFFSLLVKKLGIDLLVDNRVQLGHIGKTVCR